MPGLKEKVKNRTNSEGPQGRGRKQRAHTSNQNLSTFKTITVRNFATQKPSLKNLPTGIKTISSHGSKLPLEDKKHDFSGVISTISMALPTPKRQASSELTNNNTRGEWKPVKEIPSAFDALLSTRSFSIVTDKPAIPAAGPTESKSLTLLKHHEGLKQIGQDFILQGDKIKTELPIPKAPRVRPNVSTGGLEVRRQRVRSEAPLARTNGTSKSSLTSRYSEQAINERKKFQEHTYTPDPRLKLCGIKSREPPKLLIENGKRLLLKTQRRASIPQPVTPKAEQPKYIAPEEPILYSSEDRTTKRDKDRTLSILQALDAVEPPPGLDLDDSAPPSAVPFFQTNDPNRLPLELSAIQLKAATIKEQIDPLELKEEGILDLIRSPNDDIDSRALSRLLGEQRIVPMRMLKNRIWEKVSRSQDLISPRPSITSLSTSASSPVPCPAVEADNSSEGVSCSKDLKRKYRRKARRRKHKQNPTSHPNIALCGKTSSDLQMRICMEKQEELEAQVSEFLAEVRKKMERSLQSCSPETLDTLESLVKTQTEIIQMQMDIKKRYMENKWNPISRASTATDIEPEDKTGREPILNAFNMDYGRISLYARETNGKIEFYCPTCKVSCENEMKFRLHLEGVNHVTKAHKELQSSQPWYSCNQCKMQIQGTTQYLSHVVDKKHNITRKNSHSSLAVSVLENKRSFHNILTRNKK